MSYVIMVSSSYAQVIHGPWRDRVLVHRTAAQWNRAFDRRGWPLRAHVFPVLDKSAATRDHLGQILVEAAEQSQVAELAAQGAEPCQCAGLDVDPATITDEHPDGICACGHVPDEHANDGTCDALVIPVPPEAERLVP